MHDPLENFDWNTLYKQYDKKCNGFDASSIYLKYFNPQPASDRELYYSIIKAVSILNLKKEGMPVDLYLAIMYWKLYSQPAAVANICKYILDNEKTYNRTAIDLKKYLSNIPEKMDYNPTRIIRLMDLFNDYNIRGAKSSDALPVRTTILHFIYPEVVPIFDKMVLQAVGVGTPDANKDVNVLKKYLPFSRKLSEKYSSYKFKNNETSIRIIDMALWINRGE